MPENRTGAIASETNRRLTKALESAGRARGFIVRSEYPVPGGRLDVVWCTDIVPPLPGVEDAVPVVAFEIESSWRTRKHIKGDLLNILENHQNGDRVSITLLRNGQRQERIVTLGQPG